MHEEITATETKLRVPRTKKTWSTARQDKALTISQHSGRMTRLVHRRHMGRRELIDVDADDQKPICENRTHHLMPLLPELAAGLGLEAVFDMHEFVVKVLRGARRLSGVIGRGV